MAHNAATVKPVFDASLIYMAINVLEEELEQADCFGNIQYSEIQENFVAKRRVLQHESLRSDWFKVLRSGEVLLILFRMSDKVRNELERCNCPLQPALEGSEQSSWQRLRVQFRCNWQSLYSIIDYLRKYFPVKVDGLDPSGKVIVDCTDPEMARTIVIGALTQCFVLLGKPSPVVTSGDHHRQPAAAPDPVSCKRQQPTEDSNNNAGNPAKLTVLQPKVNRLSNKKRVICIYDTTTSEDSDRASIDATPIDNRNSIDVQKQQQQQQPQPQNQSHVPPQQPHEHQQHHHEQQQSQNQLQQGPSVSYADSSPESVLSQVLLRLDEVKTLLTANGLSCQSCRQRAHEAAAAAAGAVSNTSSNAAADDDPVDEASDSASDSASKSTPPPQPRQLKNVHSSAAASVIPFAPIPHVAAAPAGAITATPSQSAADAAAPEGAITAALSKSAADAAAPAGAITAAPSQSAADAAAPAGAITAALSQSAADAAAKPSRRRTLRKFTTKRQAVYATKLVSVHATNLVSDLQEVPVAVPDAVSNTMLRRSQTRKSAKSVDADIHSTQQRNAKRADKSGGKQRRMKVVMRRVVQSKSGGKEPPPHMLDVPLPVVNMSAEQRAPRAGSGDNRKKLGAQQPQPHVAAPVSGANVNNDVMRKPITKSTVQDLINKLQAVINEDA